MTLTDKEYQRMRDASIAIMREIGVEHRRLERPVRRRPGDRPHAGHRDEPARVAVERARLQGHRASRSPRSPPSSPIGYTLDELHNDITRVTPASFEPTIDYVVVKWPRFAFEKFPGAKPLLGHADEVRRRGDGDRPDVPRGVRQGDPLARDRARRVRPVDGRDRRRPRLDRARDRADDPRPGVPGGARVPARPDRRARARADPDRPVVPPPHPRDGEGGARARRPGRRTRSAPACAATSGWA